MSLNECQHELKAFDPHDLIAYSEYACRYLISLLGFSFELLLIYASHYRVLSDQLHLILLMFSISKDLIVLMIPLI